jgi:hypothetical protein
MFEKQISDKPFDSEEYLWDWDIQREKLIK